MSLIIQITYTAFIGDGEVINNPRRECHLEISLHTKKVTKVVEDIFAYFKAVYVDVI